MDVSSGVCLFVTLSVCQHDNFRTIKRRMLKPVGALYKNLARVRMSRSKVKGQGNRGQQKTKKCGILFGSRPLGHGPPPVLLLRRWENQRMLSTCMLCFNSLFFFLLLFTPVSVASRYIAFYYTYCIVLPEWRIYCIIVQSVIVQPYNFSTPVNSTLHSRRVLETSVYRPTDCLVNRYIELTYEIS